ncbi:MAG: hypothetical protein CM1200mP26_14870 [Acidimicrobiales bacterium]|nr:MAG: hypothetical protein CM1200mP26_14870 [Acidimicrobiales bacterium]
MSVLQIERRDRWPSSPSTTLIVETCQQRDEDELLAAFDELEADEKGGCRCAHWSWRAFCAGAVLDDLLEPGEVTQTERCPTSTGASSGWPNPAPTVAAVNGAAVGAGMNMILACDLVVAGRSARFDSRFLTIGSIPVVATLGDSATSPISRRPRQWCCSSRPWTENRPPGGRGWDCVDDDVLLDQAVEYAERAAGHPRELWR